MLFLDHFLHSCHSGVAKFHGSFVFNRKRNIVELEIKQDMCRGTAKYVVRNMSPILFILSIDKKLKSRDCNFDYLIKKIDSFFQHYPPHHRYRRHQRVVMIMSSSSLSSSLSSSSSSSSCRHDYVVIIAIVIVIVIIATCPDCSNDPSPLSSSSLSHYVMIIAILNHADIIRIL